MLSRILVILISLFSTAMRADEPAPVRISLGGPRKVEAIIAAQDGGIEITVRMIGIGCFDSATNNRLNRERARVYAMHALARHLGKQTFVVKGVTVGEAHTEGKTYSLIVIVPKDGLVPATQAIGKATPKEGNAAKIDLDKFRGLLTAKEDYIATLRQLSRSMVEDLPPTPADMKHENDFFRSVADLEESGVNSFSALRKEVRSDKRLLTIEADEVIVLLEKEEANFIERLKKHVDRFHATAKKE